MHIYIYICRLWILFHMNQFLRIGVQNRQLPNLQPGSLYPWFLGGSISMGMVMNPRVIILPRNPRVCKQDVAKKAGRPVLNISRNASACACLRIHLDPGVDHRSIGMWCTCLNHVTAEPTGCGEPPVIVSCPRPGPCAGARYLDHFTGLNLSEQHEVRTGDTSCGEMKHAVED